jgi:hypothetical protein
MALPFVEEVAKRQNKPPNYSGSGPSFEALVDEILIHLITHFLAKKDIWSLALASRRYNEITTPILYSEICLLRPTTPDSDFQHDVNLLSAQRCVRVTLETHPHLASYVRRISWHLDGERQDIPSFIRFVTLLNNVKEAHFSSSYALPRLLSNFSCASAILPICTCVTLEGLTSLDFAMSVIHPHQLQELALESDYQFTIPILEWISLTSFPHLTSIHIRLRFQVVLSTPAAGEYQALMACKQALLSLRGSLENVTIGLRKAKAGHATFSFLSNPLANAAQKVPRYVLPVFLEEQFPRMRRLQLEGMRIGHPGISSRLIEDIQVAIPSVAIDVIPAKSVGNAERPP